MNSTLSSSLIGYTPIVDAKRNVIASRVVVAPQQANVSAATVYSEFSALTPEVSTAVLLSIRDASFAADLAAVKAHELQKG
jgi:hypothetical protein